MKPPVPTELEMNLRISIFAVCLALFSFLLDHYLLNQTAIFVTIGITGAEFAFIIYFIRTTLKHRQRISISTIFLFFYSVFFLISDSSFALQYYFKLHQDEFLSVSSITVPNTLGFLFSALALSSRLKSYIRTESDDIKSKMIVVALVMVGQYLLIAYLLFGSTFAQKYGPFELNYFNIFRFAAVFTGALTAGVGAFCLCVSEDPTMSLLGLGLNLQVMGDWSLRLKEYLQFDKIFGISEYVFFSGVLITLGAASQLNSHEISFSRFKMTTQSAGQRLRLLIPIHLLTIAAVILYGNDAHVIELLFIFIAVVSITTYRDSVIGNSYLTAIRALLDEDVNSTLSEHKALPDEFVSLKTAINGKIIELSQFRAVAITAQYLAHDIKRPFSILRTGANLIKDAKSESEIKTVVQTLLPNLSRSMTEVEAVLENVVDISKPAKLNLEPYGLEELVRESLQSILGLYSNNQIKIGFYFSHKCKLLIDLPRCRRAVDNIVLNAVQAIHDKPLSDINQMWFRSMDLTSEERKFVVLEIGNFGSYIPHDLQKHIFDDFFSVGKKDGSGLGLAIAKKVIELHGGMIELHSSENPKTVVFKIHFPAIAI